MLINIYTDNKGYYNFNEFERYYYEYSIIHEKTILGTPWHNSVVDRIKYTIMKKVIYIYSKWQSCLSHFGLMLFILYDTE